MRIGEREERVKVRERENRYEVTIGDQVFDVDVASVGGSTLSLLMNGQSHEAEMVPRDKGYLVQLATRSLEVEVEPELLARAGAKLRRTAAPGPLAVTSPMPGLVVQVKARPGQQVAADEPLVIVEAMKMQNELTAGVPGTVKEVRVEAGQGVSAGQVLVLLDAAPAPAAS